MKTKLSLRKREIIAEQFEDFAGQIKYAGRTISTEFAKDLGKIANTVRENTLEEYPEIELLVDEYLDQLKEEIIC